MTREIAIKLLRSELDKHYKTQNWGIRLSTSDGLPYVGKCLESDQLIVLNAHILDQHPDSEIIDTIRHEVAHALVGNIHGHNEIWKQKAIELGATPKACSNYELNPHIIEAIRSNATVEIEWEDKTIHIAEQIKVAKYKITRLQDKCPICAKVAVEKSSIEIDFEGAHNKRFITLECGHTIVKLIKKGTPFHEFISNRDLDHVANCIHDWGTDYAPNQCKHCGEFKPYDFQLVGMREGEAAYAVHNGWGCFDDMGLGKTPQTLALINYDETLWPVLYIVKSKIKFQWFKQILIWLGPKHLSQIITGSNDYLIPGLKGYIISYDMLVHKTRKSKTGKVINQGFDIEKFEKIGIKSIVIDECQQISNPNSERTRQVRRLAKNCKVFALSGTPWKNRGSEFYSALNMIAPTLFSSYEGFKRAWVGYYYDGNKDKEGGIRDIPKFKQYTKGLITRREFHEVMSQMPKVTRMKLYVQMSKDENSIYEDAVQEFVDWYNKAIIDGDEETLGTINLIAKMSRMRHLTGLAKIDATVDYVEEFVEETDTNIIIFVHHQDVGVMMLDQLREKFPTLNVCSLTAKDSDSQVRAAIIDKFNSRRSIMVASTLASGEGVDGLQKSCYTLIMHERQWNPANEEQPERRLLRIGQTSKKINAIYAEASDSIDEFFGGIVEHKRREFHKSMNTSEEMKWSESDMVKELAQLIVKKHTAKRKKSA